VTAVTVGTEEDEEVLRRCLAMGADKAIRVETGDFLPDSFAVAKILAQVIKGMPHDLVLTGVQADDLNEGSVGTMAAELLDLAHAAVVTGIAPEGDGATVRVELEGGMEEVSKIKLPGFAFHSNGHQRAQVCFHHGHPKSGKKRTECGQDRGSGPFPG
jgi:electron transfer flavoprotein beta subunit